MTTREIIDNAHAAGRTYCTVRNTGGIRNAVSDWKRAGRHKVVGVREGKNRTIIFLDNMKKNEELLSTFLDNLMGEK